MSIRSNLNKTQATSLLVVGSFLLAFAVSFEYFFGGYDFWNGTIYGFSFSLMIMSIFGFSKLKTTTKSN